MHDLVINLVLLVVILGGLGFLIASSDESGRTRTDLLQKLATAVVMVAMIIALARRPLP